MASNIKALATANTGPRRRQKGLPLIPALLVVVAVTQVPFFVNVFVSLWRWLLLRPDRTQFVGLGNFVDILTSGAFWEALGNTAIIAGGSVILSLVVGLGLALMLNRDFKGRWLARTAAITPFFVMPAVASFLWKALLFDPTYGFLQYIEAPFFHDPIVWTTALPKTSLILVTTWMWTPLMMVIILAGLQSLSVEVLEAAALDGAGTWPMFRHVVLPLIRPYLELSALFGSLFILQQLDPVILLTQGGPGTATTTVPYLAYQANFLNYAPGKAAAIGFCMVLITLIILMEVVRRLAHLFVEPL